MQKLAFIFVVFFLAFAIFSINAFATTIILNESNNGNVGDTYIDSDYPDTNYGSEWSLEVGLLASGTLFERIFFLFDINLTKYGIPNIINANLSFYCGSGTSGYAKTRHLIAYNTSNNWDESNITWGNQPSIDVLQENVTISSNPLNSWLYFNVTDSAISSSIQSNNNMSIMIRDDNETYGLVSICFSHSKEYEDDVLLRPQLVITYTSLPTSINLYLNGAQGNLTGVYPITLNSTATINASVWVAIDINNTLSANDTQTATNITILPAGLWNITAYFNGDDSYIASSKTYWVDIAPSPPSKCSIDITSLITLFMILFSLIIMAGYISDIIKDDTIMKFIEKLIFCFIIIILIIAIFVILGCVWK